MKRNLIVAPIAALGVTLAGCGETAYEDAHHGVEAEAEAALAKDEEVAEEPLQSDDDSSEQNEASSIPAKYHAAWDAADGFCAPESDARMEIGAKEIIFFESVGTVQSVQEDGDTLVVALQLEGEGEQWEENFRFALEEDDTILRVTNLARPDDGGDFPRKRCD